MHKRIAPEHIHCSLETLSATLHSILLDQPDLLSASDSPPVSEAMIKTCAEEVLFMTAVPDAPEDPSQASATNMKMLATHV